MLGFTVVRLSSLSAALLFVIDVRSGPLSPYFTSVFLGGGSLASGSSSDWDLFCTGGASGIGAPGLTVCESLSSAVIASL